MGRGFFGQLNQLVKDVTQRTSDALSRQEAAMVRGKVSGRTVLDDDGNMLVDAGHIIDDTVIERAAAVGKLHLLVMAAGTARVQDLQEAAQGQIDKTGGGREAKAYNSIDDYAEARAYIGRYAGVDVTDVRGNVVIPMGRKLSDDDIRTARDAGLLSALMFAAQQPYSPPQAVDTAPALYVKGPFEDEAPSAPPPRQRLAMLDPASGRMRPGLPLVTPEEKDTHSP